MKIKQEVIEATYDITELTKEEYDIIKSGIRLFEFEDCRLGYQRFRDGSESKKANEMLKKFF